MRLTRSSVRRATTGLAAAGLLAGTLFLAPTAASAAPADKAADTRAATADLDATARIPGTAWVVNSATGKVEVTVDETVTGAKWQHLVGVVAKHQRAISIERTAGTLSMLIRGGDAIYTGGARCSLGFNVRSGSGRRYLLTAGHCTNIGATWYANASRTVLIGPRVVSRFPGDDYGIVRYDNLNLSNPGSVNRYDGTFQDITGAANPSLNQSACRSGSTTGLRCGRVTGLNATVNYPQGTVTGMIRTNICAEPGDSGGSLFSGTTALGLTSGGSGNCTTGGTTFFQPVMEPINRHGVNVY